MARSRKQQSLGATIKEVTLLLLIVFVIRTFGFGLYQVPTGSMETTMLVGERFFADKFSYLFSAPKRGDIIAFNDPQYAYSTNRVKRLIEDYVWGPSNWTKRIIGQPGDTVRGTVEDGKPVVYLNGEKLDEPYLNQYPLLALYSTDINTVVANAQNDAARQAARGLIDKNSIESYISYYMLSAINWRSYDARLAPDRQPFYRFTPGQVVRFAQESSFPGSVIKDGKMVKEPNVPVEHDVPAVGARKAPDRQWGSSDEFNVKLGADEYWLMGDNRRGSKDSRFIGPVTRRFIHGRILYRIWSIDSMEAWWIYDLIKHPISFWQRIRWNRFFQRIR